jgi:hypothetical protein
MRFLIQTLLYALMAALVFWAYASPAEFASFFRSLL